MSSDDPQVTVPGWIFKWALGILQAIMMTALVATITWAWNSEGRLAALELRVADQQAEIAKLESRSDLSSKNHTEIEVLKAELTYIKTGIDDLKVLLRGR